MVIEIGACQSRKCTSMKAKYEATSQRVHIDPMPLWVGMN